MIAIGGCDDGVNRLGKRDNDNDNDHDHDNDGDDDAFQQVRREKSRERGIKNRSVENLLPGGRKGRSPPRIYRVVTLRFFFRPTR